MVTIGSTRPAYGRRLVPQVLDELAITDPGRVYAAIPKTADVRDGYHDITVADLARCVNFTAKWIEDKFGKSDIFETITYVGLSDLRGIVTLLAAIKTGYKLLVPSPRNPPAVNCHLMTKTSSTKLLYAGELAPLIKPLQALVSAASSDPVPSLQVMLDSKPEPYHYVKSFEDARQDPIVVLHSSGSTGLPKPITITHGSVGAHDNDHNLPAPAGRKKMDTTVFTLDGDERRLYLILPFFHLGGFVFFMDHAILNNLTLVLGPPHVAPDATLLKEIAQQQKLRAIMVVPAILEQLLHDPKGLNLLKSFEFVACAGAPLPSSVGGRIAGIIKLYIFIGSTETFPLPELQKSPEDWQYHEFSPNLEHEMRPYDDKTGTFELIIIADDKAQDKAPVYHNLPGENPFYTKDLFTRHPTKSNLYKYYGRRDDIIVLANGEKVNPIPLEQHVQGDSRLQGVLLVGSGRVQAALLVEPREPLDEAGRKVLLEALWSRIEEANMHVSGQGRVLRGMVLCAIPGKPFARTGKGTIVRKLTEDAYSDEIEHLYSSSSRDERIVTVSLKPGIQPVYEPAAISEFLRQVFAVSFPPALVLGDVEDFFAHGLDSIQTLQIAANLKRNLEGLTANSTAWISPRIIFRHSSLSDLSKVLGDFLNNGTAPTEDSNAARASAVDNAVARYTKNLPLRTTFRDAATTAESSSTVAIIGSTGYIGSHLVANELKNPVVTKIYCLDRGIDASTRLQAILDKIDKNVDTSKLAFFRVEFGAPYLGLSQDQYQRIADEVHVIVYNAWRLDFGLAIHSFDPFLRATRELVDLSVASQHRLRIVFVSSLSSVEGLALTGSRVPEAPIIDPLAAMNTGYGQSKLAAERILVTASQQSDISVSIVRIGQVGGSSMGERVWADQPWLSAIIRTSKTLGMFPSPVAPVDWVSVDDLTAILESVIHRQAVSESTSPKFFNVVSDPQPWIVLVDVLRELDPENIFKLVPLPEWVDKLRQSSDQVSADVAKLPALRLLDFYEGLGSGAESLKYATEYTRIVSGVDLGPLKQDVLASWLEAWDLQ